MLNLIDNTFLNYIGEKMPTSLKILIAATALFSQALYATSVEDYVAVCTANQNNRMDENVCRCMANEGKKLSDEEFEFFYAIAAKDQEKVNKGHATLGPNQKVNVMTLSMMGPSKCANEMATQNNSTNEQAAPESASSTNITTESMSGAASASQ